MLLLSDLFYSHFFDWDKKLFQTINGHNSPFWDQVMGVVTSVYFGLAFCLFLSVLILVYYRKHAWKIVLFIALTTLLADTIGARLLKPAAQRLRPSHDPEYHGDYQVHLHQRRDGTFYYGGRYSWPSNHAINYLTTSILFFYFLRTKVRRRWLLAVFIFGTTLLVCYSRIYVGVHYPFDILCGWLIAAFLAGLAVWVISLTPLGIGNRERTGNRE